jgi:hypothetical protein
LISALTGITFQSVTGGLKDVGFYTITLHFLIPAVNFALRDPYTELQLPPELAPDGLLDFMISDSTMHRAPDGSLVVIEEPEIHKNP